MSHQFMHEMYFYKKTIAVSFTLTKISNMFLIAVNAIQFTILYNVLIVHIQNKSLYLDILRIRYYLRLEQCCSNFHILE